MTMKMNMCLARSHLRLRGIKRVIWETKQSLGIEMVSELQGLIGVEQFEISVLNAAGGR